MPRRRLQLVLRCDLPVAGMKRARTDVKPASSLRVVLLVVGSAFLSGQLADEMRYHRPAGRWLSVRLARYWQRACVPLPRFAH